MSYGGDSLWVANGWGPVWSFDTTLQESVVHNLGLNVENIEPGSEALWISHYGEKGHVLGRLSYTEPVDLTWLDLRLGTYGASWEPVVEGDSLWLLRPEPGGNVIEIDERTGRVIQRFRVTLDMSYGATATDDTLWITDGLDEEELVGVPSRGSAEPAGGH